MHASGCVNRTRPPRFTFQVDREFQGRVLFQKNFDADHVFGLVSTFRKKSQNFNFGLAERVDLRNVHGVGRGNVRDETLKAAR